MTQVPILSYMPLRFPSSTWVRKDITTEDGTSLLQRSTLDPENQYSVSCFTIRFSNSSDLVYQDPHWFCCWKHSQLSTVLGIRMILSAK